MAPRVSVSRQVMAELAKVLIRQERIEARLELIQSNVMFLKNRALTQDEGNLPLEKVGFKSDNGNRSTV